MSEPRYVLVRKADEQDVVHCNPLEECNTDDALSKQTIDADTADALVNLGDARQCGHCGKES